ncbi:hypothetical protein DES53_11566 [Roseimicrobium gellanilyticum]|uniref:Lipoprotein n=1 Tax=Roseimicrobium gellanilyticum TaxID=748857 RepID=A0A366H4I4_9BACT|nr:hypothetical protein [Roseimicrobium gellanilyticum]RBP36925.1 hypothetical protein DES53_11566 [Roseimicrobium gellanilyticum]
MSTLLKPCLRLAALVLCAAAFTSCQSVLPYKLGGNPANLRLGATPIEVKEEMGSPTYFNKHQNGEVWVYADYWWTKEIWTAHWGTWEVYMEDTPFGLRFCGWKLIDPPYQEPAVRSHVRVRNPQVTTVSRSTPPPTYEVRANPKPPPSVAK